MPERFYLYYKIKYNTWYVANLIMWCIICLHLKAKKYTDKFCKQEINLDFINYQDDGVRLSDQYIMSTGISCKI